VHRIVCDAVEGRFLTQQTVEALRAAAGAAEADGMDAVFLADGPLGDAITLAAALGSSTSMLLLGVRIDLAGEAHRHPTLLGREMSTFDLIVGGRALLALVGPFSGATDEAIGICRDMWRQGTATSEGPFYPVPGAVNRPEPFRAGGPPIALDLSDGARPEQATLELVDLVLVSGLVPPPPDLPAHVSVCQIQDA
jgi:alkanesulfonate monooxygenase SsuD/methylene tetrahydromethanopterin reductase-like flavin-dependent oxidoreductase (luciferase family)